MIKISVVIPCRNEANYINECVEAIYRSDKIEEMQLSVFIVDGMSDDGTREKIGEMQTTYPNLHLVDNVEQLTPFAFNLGIYAGEPADYVQIIGARHIVSSNYIARCVEILKQDAQIWCVGGRIINEYVNDLGRVFSQVMSTKLGMGIGNFRTLTASGFTDTVTSPMYPSWVFEKIGYFDEALIRNQDDDFNFRVTQAGGKIFFESTISLRYYVRGNFPGLKRQFFQYGYWKVFVNKKHQTVTTLRQLVPPVFVLYCMLVPFTLFLGFPLYLITFAPLALYGALILSFSASHCTKIHEFPLFLRAYLIVHFQYGLGYLNGLWDFVILSKKPANKHKRMSR